MTDILATRPRAVALDPRTALRGSVYILLVAVVVIGLVSSPQFRSVDNLVNVLRSVSLIGVAALGMNFVILVGSMVDLAVASTVSIAAVVTLRLSGAPIGVAIGAAVLVALALGLVNGALISAFKANPILLTLATSTIAGGVLLIATSGHVTYPVNKSFASIVNARVLGIPTVVIVLVVLTIVCQWLITSTTWGRRVLAVGGNERTARFSGISVGAIRLQAFALSGLFAGITGALLGSSTGAATPTAGQGYEFDALTAAVVGGTRLTGGRGSAIGVLAGAILIGVLSNLLILWGAPYSFQQVVKGVLLVVVVALSQIFGGDRDR